MEQNYGFDFNYKNRYSFTFEYYHSITNNAVNPLSLAPSTGFTTVQENATDIYEGAKEINEERAAAEEAFEDAAEDETTTDFKEETETTEE